MSRTARIIKIMQVINMMDAVTDLPKESDDKEILEQSASRSALQSNNVGMLYAQCERTDALLMDLVIKASVLFENHYSFFKRRARKLSANG